MSFMLKKMRVFLQDGSLKKRITQNAKQYINEQYDMKTVVEAHENLYQKMIESKRMAHAG